MRRTQRRGADEDPQPKSLPKTGIAQVKAIVRGISHRPGNKMQLQVSADLSPLGGGRREGPFFITVPCSTETGKIKQGDTVAIRVNLAKRHQMGEAATFVHR